MRKLLFIPFSVTGGLMAGFIGKKLFERVWSLVDKQQPPTPEHRDVSWRRLVVALALEGAIFRAVRGVVDRGMRQSFRTLTGVWPGERRPEPTQS